MGSSSLESGDGLGDLNLMKQPSNTQTLVLHWDWLVRGMCVLGFLAHATASFFHFLSCLKSCVLRSCFVGFGDPNGVVVKVR